MRQTANFHKAELLLPNIRGVREWLSVFPIPPIHTRSFLFPKFMHCETYSYSRTIPKNSFPFPPFPFPPTVKSLTNPKNFKPHNVYNVFRVHSHQKHHF